MLVFGVGEALYAFEASGVAFVAGSPPVTRVPQGPMHLLGVASYRGGVVPVVDLARLMDVGVTSRPEGWCAVFVAHDGHTVGVAAERTLGVVTLPLDDLCPAPDVHLGVLQALRCAKLADGRLATVLDHVRLVEFDRSLERQGALPRTRAPRGRL